MVLHSSTAGTPLAMSSSCLSSDKIVKDPNVKYEEHISMNRSSQLKAEE